MAGIQRTLRRIGLLVLIALLAGTASGCSPAPGLSLGEVRTVRFSALHLQKSWAASPEDTQRFIDAFEHAEVIDELWETTPPARVDVILVSGENIVVWGGSQKYATVKMGGRQFNVKSDELNRLLEAIAAVGK